MTTPPSVAAFFPNAKPFWPADVGRTKLQHLNQISILVDDIDEAMEHFAKTLGWGPFWPCEVENDLEYKGQPVHVKLRLAFVMVAGIEIELLQPVEGETPQSEQLKERGPGLSHLRFATPDIEAVLEQLASSGIKPIFGYAPEGRWVAVYVDSDTKYGIRYELVLPSEKLSEINGTFEYQSESK